MPRNLEKLFRQTAAVPTAGLLGRIMTGIAREKNRAAVRRQLAWLSAALFFSAAAAAYAVYAAVGAAIRAGWGDYFSATFADWQGILSSWRYFLLTLLETLPVAHLAALAAALFVSMIIVRRIDRLVAPPATLKVT